MNLIESLNRQKTDHNIEVCVVVLEGRLGCLLGTSYITAESQLLHLIAAVSDSQESTKEAVTGSITSLRIMTTTQTALNTSCVSLPFFPFIVFVCKSHINEWAFHTWHE